MTKKYFSTFLILCVLSSGSVFSQSTLATSGEEASGVGGSAEYTIGQTFTTDFSCEKGGCAVGVQKALELILVTGEVVVIEHHSGQMLICDNHEARWLTFQWYKNDEACGTLNYLYEASGLNGVYYLVVNDEYGQEYFSERFYYDYNISTESSLLVYPVPVVAGRELSVLLSQNTEETKYKVEIYNISGLLVKSSLIDSNVTSQILTSGFIKGEYILKVNGVSSKFIVQ